MIEKDIRNFNKQFLWEPVIVNQKGSTLDPQKGRTLILGMGGSHLGADLLNGYDSKMGLIIHSDYGLPILSQGSTLDLQKGRTLIIASSYSGNTEEVIDGLNQALAEGLPTAVMASGGRLLEMAKEKGLPYIELPTGLQPRMSLGFQVQALAALLGREKILDEANHLADELNPSELEERGKTLAEKLKNKIPVIYTSGTNRALAYIWKAKFHETAKSPAFYNVFPEMNHNEMTGFDSLSQPFHFLVLADEQDHPRIKRRMQIFTKLFGEKGWPVEIIDLDGEGRLFRLFSSLLLADWTSYYIARQKGVNPEQIPLVEEFKKLMRLIS